MKVLLLGGSGLVGSRFLKLNPLNFEIISPTHEEFDLLNFSSYFDYLNQVNPEIILNLAAFTNVDLAEQEVGNRNGTSYLLNTECPKNLAEASKQKNIHLVHISTDYVFNGDKDSPYIEEDQPNPKNWYGETKRLGEEEVLKSGCLSTIARIEMPFSVKFEGKKDVVRTFLELLKNNQSIKATNDQKITPIFVDFGVKAISELIVKKSLGIYHLASTNHTTPYELAVLIANKFNLNKDLIEPVSFMDYEKTRIAKRPQNSWLSVEKFEEEFGGNILHSMEDSLDQFAKQLV